MEFLPEQIEEYVEEHTSKESEVLYNLNRQTNLKVLIPRMLSGHLQGRMLSMFSHMVQPQNILEIGTYTGYSALCMAEGLKDGGQLITIDINVELEDFTRSFFDQSDYKDQIDFRIGNALDIVPTLDQKFDLVFIDADKDNYINYYEMVIEQLSDRGYIIFDNVLWSGKVLENHNDPDTQTLQKLNKLIQEDERVENVLMPIRDGLMVCRRV